jgi:hypothetical protein
VSSSQSLSQNSTHQIVAATSIDDGTNAAIFDDEENLE